MKLMVYSHDAFGLGNIRRMVAICEYLLEALPELSILVVSGSPALHQLRLPDGLDYIKLPCLGRDEAGTLGVRFLRTSPEEAVQLRSQIIRTAVNHFQPDLLLVDKKPDGLRGELRATLDDLQFNYPQTRLVLLLRDILDSPAATIAQWHQHDYYTLTENRYDQVWIVGSPDIFNAPVAYQFPPRLRAKTRFMGYIRRGWGQHSPQHMRQVLGVQPDQRLILVTPGGGGDGYHLVECYLQALPELPLAENLVSLIVGGPEMPPIQKQRLLHRIAANPNLHWLDFTDDLASYMGAADLVVSMGGYNTIGEVLSLQKRAVVVPRTHPVEEQWIRAQRMAELGLFTALHPAELTPAHLARAIAQELAQVPPFALAGESPWQILPASYPLDMNALPRITQALIGLVSTASPRSLAPLAV